MHEEAFSKLCRATDLSLCETKQMARAIGRSMGALVTTERHLWLNLTGIKDRDRVFMRNAPISPSDPSSASEASTENAVLVPNLSEGEHGKQHSTMYKELVNGCDCSAQQPQRSGSGEEDIPGLLTGLPVAVYALPTSAK
ncbi:hypothetical protein DPX16_7464 [Anabarilius grahami]|uniref:Uncharacterized protein n=1 Tax=Anabarilius grahami TaxID=495550 RepID=A0A3N0YKE5_ANAGA|nr:hypothetical protein DPX16_7464 [Anabarilius grahami]